MASTVADERKVESVESHLCTHVRVCYGKSSSYSLDIGKIESSMGEVTSVIFLIKWHGETVMFRYLHMHIDVLKQGSTKDVKWLSASFTFSSCYGPQIGRRI